MNKIWIIIQREFINRVTKKSFILLTILMPFVFAALIFVPLWLSTVKGSDQKQVAVIDASGSCDHLFSEGSAEQSFTPRERDAR